MEVGRANPDLAPIFHLRRGRINPPMHGPELLLDDRGRCFVFQVKMDRLAMIYMRFMCPLIIRHGIWRSEIILYYYIINGISQLIKKYLYNKLMSIHLLAKIIWRRITKGKGKLLFQFCAYLDRDDKAKPNSVQIFIFDHLLLPFIWEILSLLTLTLDYWMHHTVIFKMQENQARRVLPPGIEDDVVFGIMWVRVGMLKAIKPTTTAHKVLIQFWGESSPAVVYTSQTNPEAVEYAVKCPITFFGKYLIDMKKNLKIEVENLGNVHLDLSCYLKKNLQLTSVSPFEHFKGFFEIISTKNSKKVGSLQLELCANFNPQIALQQMSDDEKEEICPAKDKACQCSGECKCNPNKIKALDVLAVEKPELFREFYEEYKEKASPVKKIAFKPQEDDRIPNSLNNVPNRGAFDPQRYSQPESHTPKVNQHFPTVERILTYSNLKLTKEGEPVNKQSSRPISIKQHLPPQPPEPASQNVLKPISPVNSRQSIQREQNQKRTAVFPEGNRKESQRELKRNVEDEEVPILPALQNKGDRHLSEVSEVQKMDQSVSVEAQREILSRVVNLNAELQKEKKSPKKTPRKEVERFRVIEEPMFRQEPTMLPSPPNLILNQGHDRRKGSSLLLNLAIDLQTTSVSFSKVTKFILSYRPYGQRDSIRSGPQLPENFMMMFPVGEPQIAKMNKIPFILEFWGANDGELLGVIKLSLAKIQKGFMLDGRLNELAIKTSLFPTVIHKGKHAIFSLTDKPVGECYLAAHIGTAAQIQSYLNSPKTQPSSIEPTLFPSPISNRQVVLPTKQEAPKRNQGSFEDFTNLLQMIDSNSSESFVQHLLTLMSYKQANQDQFQTFLKNLSFKGGDIFHFLSENHLMRCKELSDCFEDYRRLKDKYAIYAASILKELTQSQISHIIQQIQGKSSFGLISKSDLSEILSSNKFVQLKPLLSQVVQSSTLIEWFKAFGKFPYKRFMIREEASRKFIEQTFFSQCPTFMQDIDNVLVSLTNNSELSLLKMKSFFNRVNKQPFSLWFWIQLSKVVYESFGEKQGDAKMINVSLLYNWLAMKARESSAKRQMMEESNYNQMIKEKEEVLKHQGVEDNRELPRDNLPNEKEKEIYGKQPSNQVRKEPISETNKQNKVINTSNLKQPQPQVSKPEQKIVQHKFTISLEQMSLEQDLSGQCTVFYRFPFEEQQISSRKLQLLRDKHKYKLACAGTHKFTINQAIEKYLGESTLSVRVALGKEGELYGDLHSEQLITQGSQFRVLPLFSVNREGMVGKIKLQIQYTQQVTSQLVLGRETIRDVFLPKNGFLNFEMRTSVDQNRLRQQFNMKDEFYLQLSLDLFGENSALSPHYPPFHSKLYSDLSSELSVSGNVKLSITPQILQHLRSGSCQARMVIVYYAKERGNYERKELLVASFKAPLFAVIRQDGLRGDYAFKNRLGMFVALAHCAIKYEKVPKVQAEGAGKVSQSRESFWLLIDFSEIVNFQGDLGWVKFEIVTKGKRFSTEKSLIREQGSYQLDSRSLCLQMGEEEFSVTKILAISVTAGSEKYGMDINLRPIAKLLGRQKYAVNSQYFLVVDDQSRSKKIRVGAKIYAFRGQANFEPFVEALSKNCIRNELAGDEKEENYQQDLQTLRKRLKMSGKSFDEALAQILDRRKKEKLPRAFFISKIQSSLDLSPILAFNQEDVYLLAEELSSEIPPRDLLEYIEQSGLKLVNLRPQFLERYSFAKLNPLHLDQNVEYLGLSKQIDLLALVSKIRIQDFSHQEASKEKNQSQRMMRISIIRGYNFNLLYNGIMPNARVCLPDVGLETEVIERSTEPVFNEHINLEISPSELKKLRVEVYHQISEDVEPILIGEGTISILQALQSQDVPYSKVTRVVLSSLMSNHLQAALDVKLQVNSRQQLPERSYSEIDESIGDSRVEQAMERVHRLNDYRKKVALFQSSDED